MDKLILISLLNNNIIVFVKALFDKLNNLNINYIYLIPSILYFYNIHEIVYPKNYQQDDVRELYVSNYLDFSCVIDAGDNHPLWTYLIWIFSKIDLIELGYIVSTFNIFLLFGATYFIFKFSNEKYGSSIAILISTLLVSSPVVITYSVSLKQYMLELFFSSYCLYVTKDNETLISKFNSINFYLVSIFFVAGSLVNAGIFAFVVLYYLLVIKVDKLNLRYFALSGLPVLFFSNRILNKINRDSYSSYWENYFITNSDSIGIFNKISFIFNMTFKSYFGFVYTDILFFLMFSIILFSLVINLKSNLFSKYIIFVFIFLNILQLYPLGTGRTDIILFPFYLSLIAEVVFYVQTKLNSNSINFLTSVILLIVLINGNPFYKQEHITPALEEIRQINDKNTAIVIASEQYPSFEYYGQKVFGSKLIKNQNCYVYNLSLNDYFIVSRKSLDVEKFNNYSAEIMQFSKILLIGIELDSRGVFRDFEDEILNSGYVLDNLKLFPDGIYFNSYELRE